MSPSSMNVALKVVMRCTTSNDALASKCINTQPPADSAAITMDLPLSMRMHIAIRNSKNATNTAFSK
jgi:hypothetical protein